ncbi:MAG: enoyl-CoA hydratase/isomerase family protein [Deltaproteobacteria bacterium]|nr:enoyl-CoA hydratase/isomerase family protein [Candidatus Anaeroferrophillus wilburensis]MBN2889448.1 enoyl-CoA hydratase/isomerase family protein [Deltaproteobacteria bacterium]
MSVLVLEKKGRCATLTLNAPESGNVYNESLAAALWQTVQEVRWDNEISVVLLQSNGRLFSGGGDLGSFKRGIDAGNLHTLIEQLTVTLNATVLAIRGMEKIFVSLVDGVCAGFGVGLALAADITLATENARFVAGYVGIGAVPDGGSSFAVLRALGLPRALDFFLSNGSIDGRQAADMGLVSRFVAAESAGQEAAALIKKLGQGPAAALARTKKLLIQGVSRSFPEHIEAERQGLIACAAGSEMKEGVAAFFAKRPANY